MVLIYLLAAYLEYTAVLSCDKPYSVFVRDAVGGVWYLLFIAPSILYVVAALMLLPLALVPGLLVDRRYAVVVAFALAPFSTAWISSSMVFCPAWDDLYELASSRWYLLWFTIGYPASYLLYAYLVYRVFDPFIGGISASELMPRFYSASTRVARVLAVPLLALSIVLLLLLAMLSPFGMFGVLIYPAIGLWLAGFSRFREKPYRFLIAFPLLGQVACLRTFIFDLGLVLNNILAGPYWVIPDSVARILAPLLLGRWLLFPIPGFGGAQASMALADYLEYRLYDRLTWINSPPTLLTAFWLFGEWLLFYKALKASARLQAGKAPA